MLVPMVGSSTVFAADWTGCYVGVQTGGMRSPSENWTVWTPGAPHANESLVSHNANGWPGGIGTGCDYTVANQTAIGLAGDVVGAGAEGRHDSTRETGVTYHSKARSRDTERRRFSTWDRWLGYVKVGARSAN